MEFLLNLIQESFLQLYPNTKSLTRYYNSDDHGYGATWIDRVYQINVNEAQYIGVSFLDHLALIVKFQVPDSFSKLLPPSSKPLFKANPVVVKDMIFKARLEEQFALWSEVKHGMEFMVWWEVIVKPGIKRLLLQRSKEINREKRGSLNLLLIRQSYLVKKLHEGYYER